MKRLFEGVKKAALLPTMATFSLIYQMQQKRNKKNKQEQAEEKQPKVDQTKADEFAYRAATALTKAGKQYWGARTAEALGGSPFTSRAMRHWTLEEWAKRCELKRAREASGRKA